MAQRKRRFIRLEEIEKRTSLTKEEVLDSIDDGELHLCAKVEVKHAGALFAVKDKPVVGAVFDYRGFVRLGWEDSKHFAAYNKEKMVEMFQILEPEKVSGWQSVTEAFGAIEKYIIPYMNKLPARREKPFWAYPEVIYDVTGFQSVGQMITEMFTAEMKEKMGDELNRLNTRYLQNRKLTIEPHSLRIDLNQIAERFGLEVIKDTVPAPTIQKQPEASGEVVFTNPIKQILHRVLLKHPKSRSDKVLVLLRKDIHLETGREFDTDAVIDDITNDDITYFGRGDVVLTMSYRRFQNLLSEVRNELKN
ncbi:hypothetical protein VA7868_01927 [Vibrio aerogenes CECT 7868]|uniref:Uncharacterized protein n=1 Tax=Vibrio aerogenes CECT 7868 TaxID=1216006 RepID=A0A1M5YS36_9VIBR|nr:hypothetical protein [Vibrio aerogenes]SHI14650.1 hypothetical protein VA7868_01927 [Vibrio aerogenes CECT 7868]